MENDDNSFNEITSEDIEEQNNLKKHIEIHGESRESLSNYTHKRLEEGASLETVAKAIRDVIYEVQEDIDDVISRLYGNDSQENFQKLGYEDVIDENQDFTTNQDIWDRLEELGYSISIASIVDDDFNIQKTVLLAKKEADGEDEIEDICYIFSNEMGLFTYNFVTEEKKPLSSDYVIFTNQKEFDNWSKDK